MPYSTSTGALESPGLVISDITAALYITIILIIIHLPTSKSTNQHSYYAKPTFPYSIGCFGPGAYGLEEEKSTLEMLPEATDSGRKWNGCPGGQIPSQAFGSQTCEPCAKGRYSSAAYRTAQQIKASSTRGCPSVCPVGSYCPSGCVKPLKCPPGRFGASTGLGDISCSGM